MLAISRDPDGIFAVAVDGRGINTHSNQQLFAVSLSVPINMVQVCTSGDADDLALTDAIAEKAMNVDSLSIHNRYRALGTCEQKIVPHRQSLIC